MGQYIYAKEPKDQIAEFKKNNTFEERLQKFNKYKTNYPEKIPIIVYTKDKKIFRHNHSDSKYEGKFLMSGQNIVHDLYKALCGRLNLKLFALNICFFVVKDAQEIQLVTNVTFKEIYEKYKDDDGFLYIHYEDYQFID